MENNFKGVIEAVSEKNFGIKIGEIWYNTKEEDCKKSVVKELKGAEVELKMCEDGKSFDGLNIITKAPEKPKSPQQKSYENKDDYWSRKLEFDKSIQPKIIRESCVRSVCILYQGQGSEDINEEFIISVAKKLEKYCSITGE